MYVFQRGETIRIPLNLIEGDKGDITNLRAKLKKAGPNGTPPPADTPVAANFTFIDSTDGWILQVAASTSLNLTPGLYVVNAAMDVGGQEVISSPAPVRIQESTL